MKRRASLLLGLFGVGCATTTTERLHLPVLQTVSHVDLDRYLGTWHEIANFPQSFQPSGANIPKNGGRESYSETPCGCPDFRQDWSIMTSIRAKGGNGQLQLV